MSRGSRTQPGPRAPSPGEPSLRALAAMASAARRARTYDGETGWDEGDEETGPRRLVSRATAGGRPLRAPRGVPVPSRTSVTTPGATHEPTIRDRAAGARRARWGLERWAPGGRPSSALLMAAAGVLVLSVAGIALALALRSPAYVGPPASRPTRASQGQVERPRTSNRSPHRPSHSRAATSGAAPTVPSQPLHTTTTPTSAAAGPAVGTAASPTSAAAGTAAGPRLTAVSPSSGRVGQRVVVRGSGLFSRNGQVLAYFGGTAAPTSCRSQTSCTVTVPDLGGRPGTMYLSLLTESGRSNALAFSYR